MTDAELLESLNHVVLPQNWFRLFAVWCVRNTPVAGGGTVWTMLDLESSRNAVIMAQKVALWHLDHHIFALEEAHAGARGGDGSENNAHLVAARSCADEQPRSAAVLASSKCILAAGAGIPSTDWAMPNMGADTRKRLARRKAEQAQADHLRKDEAFMMALAEYQMDKIAGALDPFDNVSFQDEEF